MSPVVLLAVAVPLLVLLGVLVLLKRMLHMSSPNQVLVLSGGRRPLAERVVSYRTIRGGRAILLPMVERLDVFELTTIAIELESVEVITRGALPLRLTLKTVVRPAAEEPLLGRALECLLGRSRQEIAAIAKAALSGVLLGVARRVTAEEIVLDTAAFEAGLREEQEQALRAFGLELDSVRVAEIPDAYGYEQSLRRR